MLRLVPWLVLVGLIAAFLRHQGGASLALFDLPDAPYGQTASDAPPPEFPVGGEPQADATSVLASTVAVLSELVRVIDRGAPARSSRELADPRLREPRGPPSA